MATEEGLRSGASDEAPASAGAVEALAPLPELSMATAKPAGIKIGRSVTAAEENGKPGEMEVFTMTLGSETIKLLPLRNWGQLDLYKWRVRGQLPATPPGLEIT